MAINSTVWCGSLGLLTERKAMIRCLYRNDWGKEISFGFLDDKRIPGNSGIKEWIEAHFLLKKKKKEIRRKQNLD